MDEKKLDLNSGEETPAGEGQPEEQTPEEFSDEIEDVDIQPDSEEDDSVVLSKDKFDKLVEAKENYKKGLLSYKEKLKSKPKEEAPKEAPKETPVDEKKAIESFIKENPEMEDKWSDLIQYYSGARGRDSIDSIKQDLDDAKTLYLKYNPPKESEDKKARADLSTETSLPAVEGKGEKPKKGGLIPKKVSPSEWY
jgi:hypothetical protein